MKHDARAYLHDIKEAGRHILEFTNGMSMEDYSRSELVKAEDATVWSAIESNLRTLLEEVETLQNS
jgi:hypothetical protein